MLDNLANFNQTILLFTIGFIVGYLSRRRLYLAALDPLKILALQEGAWLATMGGLHHIGSMTELEFDLILLCLILWWGTWFFFSTWLGPNYRRAIRVLVTRFAEIKPREVQILTLICFTVAALFAIASLVEGGGGDYRVTLMKKLRIFEGFLALLTPFVLYRLLIAPRAKTIIAFILLLFLHLIWGGKGSILIVLLPFTLATYGGYLKENPRIIAGILTLLVLGLGLTTAVSYGVRSPTELLTIMSSRLLFEGDVYLLAFSSGGLDHIELESLTLYVFAPLLKLLMLPIQFDENIGAQIANALSGENGFTGPNGHWPVLLMASGVDNFSLTTFYSVLFFFIAVVIPLGVLTPRRVARWPTHLLVTWSVFALSYPKTFYGDPSYVSAYLVHAIIVSVALKLVLQSAKSRQRQQKSKICPT